MAERIDVRQIMPGPRHFKIRDTGINIITEANTIAATVVTAIG